MPSSIIGKSHAVATGSNRLNSSGKFVNAIGQTSILYENTIAASVTVNGVTSPGTLDIPLSGTQFYLVYSTGGITIKPDSGAENPYPGQGTGLGELPLENAFSLLTLKNYNNFDVTFQLWIGFVPYIDKRLILSTGGQSAPLIVEPQATTMLGAGITQINANATLAFTGQGQSGLRKQIVVANLDAANNLQITDSNDNIFYIITPLNSFTVECSDYINVVNPNNAIVSCSIGEIFFTK